MALQVGRTGFVVAALPPGSGLRRNFQRILAWFAASGVFWLAGGIAQGRVRDGLWLVGVVVHFAGPASGFFTPGLGRSRTTDWVITGALLAERCQLFMIIALGESVLVSGATFGGYSWTAARVAAALAAFIGTVAFWWIYFYRSADGGMEVITSAADPGRLGRLAYTYFHLPMVAGIIVTAVADEVTIAHPAAHAGPAITAVLVGGPALFVAGHALFKWSFSGRVYVSRLVALLALGAVVPVSIASPRLVPAILTSLILVALASWETWRVWRITNREDEQPAEVVPPVVPSQVPG